MSRQVSRVLDCRRGAQIALGVRESREDRAGVDGGHQGSQRFRPRTHLRQLCQPGQVQFVILQAEYEKQMSGLAVESVEIDAAARSAQDHERFDYVLGMAIERVQESESVTDRARHDILALDKSADEPGLVPHQIQPAGQICQLLDDSGFGGGLEVGNYVAWLKATRELQP